MQLRPPSASTSRTPDPAQNIKAASSIWRWLLAYFEGNVALVAAGYNAGEGADRYGGIPPYRETRKLCAADPDAVRPIPTPSSVASSSPRRCPFAPGRGR